MNRLALAGSRKYRLCPWVARLSNAWFPWRFNWKGPRLRARIAGLWAGDLWIFRSSRATEKKRPKRRPVSLEVDQLGPREAPTGIVAVDPVTAHLVSFAALHESLPPVVQNVEHPAQQASALKSESGASSPLYYWGRTSSSVIGVDGASSSPAETASSPFSARGSSGDSSSPLSTRFGERGAGGERGPAAFLSTMSGAGIALNLPRRNGS